MMPAYNAGEWTERGGGEEVMNKKCIFANKYDNG